MLYAIGPIIAFERSGRQAAMQRFARGAWRLALALLAGLASLASPLYADAYQSLANQRNMLPGGRAAMMGGAYTAIADDASGSYYNPAGLSFATADRLEVSGTAFSTSSTVYEKAVEEEPVVERSSTIYPSFFGSTARLGALTFAYSYLTLDARNVYQHDEFSQLDVLPGSVSSYARTYHETSNYNWIGASSSLKLGKSWSLGVSLFYYQRDITLSTHEVVVFHGGGARSIASTLKTLNIGLAAACGLLWHGESWSIGAVMRRARSLSDHSNLYTDQVGEAGAAGESGVRSSHQEFEALNELNPPSYVVGWAWTPARWLLVAGDVMLHEGVKTPHPQGRGFDLHTTLNYSLGFELDFKHVSILGGWFTNYSMYREPQPEAINQPAWLDLTGVSGGIGWNIRGVVGQLGVVRQSGTGKAQILTDSPAVQTTRSEMMTYLISGKIPL